MPTDRESAEQSAAHEVLTMTLAEAAEAITSLEAENKRLREAVSRQVDNIERWLETGEPASKKESRSIYEQLKAALFSTKGAS